MAVQPHWKRNGHGWYPLPAKVKCTHCREELWKRHGVNRNRDDRDGPTVQGLFLFGVGPFCIHCGLKAWNDPDFFNRSGHSDYLASHHDLMRDFRPKLPSIQDELKKL